MSNQTERSRATPGSIFRRVLQGYRHLFMLLAGLLPIFVGILLLSAVVVLPLWYLATHHRPLYTTIVLALSIGGLLFLAIRRLIRHRARGGRYGRLITALLALGAAYATVRLAVLAAYLPALLTLLPALLFTGLTAAPKRRV